MMVTKLFIIAAIAIYAYGCPYDQNATTKHLDKKRNSILIDISEKPMRSTSMNSTKCECECEFIRDNGNQLLILMFGFTVGSLAAGTIAGIIILQIQFQNMKERQKNEDTILNIIEWNELRRNARRIAFRCEVAEEEEGEEEEVMNDPQGTVHEDVEAIVDQELETMV